MATKVKDGEATTTDGRDVYVAIHAVMTELGKVGISKARENRDQGFKFRGIDQVYEALSPLLTAHGLLILPRMTDRSVMERETRSGGTMLAVSVRAEFDFVAVTDRSMHTIATYGEAQDTADKATNKAMSAAYKYACFLAFCIPVEGEEDADATTPEESRPKAPEGFNEFKLALVAASEKGNKALNTVWKAAADSLRAHLDNSEPKIRPALKARSLEVDRLAAESADNA